MMRGTCWIWLFFTALICLAACAPKAQNCTDYDSASNYVAQTLEQLAVVIEQTPDTAQALVKVESMLGQSKSNLDICAQILNSTLQQAEPETVMTSHEKFLADPRVRRFLDAQDKFQESASPDQIEKLDDLVTPLYISAE